MVLLVLTAAAPIQAAEIYQNGDITLDLSMDLGLGVYHSGESYAQTSVDDGNKTWTEASADINLTGTYLAPGKSSLYVTLGALATGTRGDGDAAGFTTGEEERLDIEDAILGWRSGELFPLLGENGLEVSVGRQNFMLGSGFLIDGDALNFGHGFDDLAASGAAPGSLDRGGAYWLGRRHAFDNSALVTIGSDTPFSATVFWLNSDNRAQAETELAGVDLRADLKAAGALALSYLHGLSVDEEWATFLGYEARDGQDTYSVRYDGSFLKDSLTLSGEYVYQDDGETTEKAWYAEVAWEYSALAWTPRTGVRVSDFSDGFDPLFYGFSTGYGTWFQGEVAGNYAGPFNTNSTITHLHLRLHPSQNLTLGALFFDFDTKDTDELRLDGRELDLFATWKLNDTLTLSPLLGLFKPESSTQDRGVQLDTDDLNIYAQLVMLLEL